MKRPALAASLLLLWMGMSAAVCGQGEGQKTGGSPAGKSNGAAILRIGDSSVLVADIQRTLRARANEFPEKDRKFVSELTVDGFYGAKTAKAVKAFKSLPESVLEPTGEVDADTLAKLEPLLPRSVLLRWVMKRSWVIQGRPNVTKHLAALIMCIPILIIGAIAYRFAGVWVNWLTHRLAQASTTTWDDALVENHFFRRAALFAPALVIYFSAGLFDQPGARVTEAFSYHSVFEFWHTALHRISLALMAVAGALVAEAFGRACESIYSRRQREDAASVRGIIQAVRLFVFSVGAILFFAALSGSNPIKLIAGLGAFMAIILLVFKDTILGLVASIQIIANDLLNVGDWIEVPKYGADGDVMDISLTTIKVQNFDKTVSTIPTHALMSESFRNWRPMNTAGGRRIKRSLHVDMNTIKVASEDLIQSWERIEILRDYLQQKESELEAYNDLHETDASTLNGRQLTNIGTYRAYVEAYVKSHEQINQEMTCLVRQLAPTKVGLPIEVYVFCSNTAWAAYESIQADMFDHFLAILPEFELRAFQDVTNEIPAGSVDESPDVTASNGPPVGKLKRLDKKVADQNSYLQEHPRASVATALRKIESEVNRLGLADIVSVSCAGREISTGS